MASEEKWVSDGYFRRKLNARKARARTERDFPLETARYRVD